MWTSGPQVTALGVGGVCAVFLAVYLECTKLGEVNEISQNFILNSKHLAARDSFYRKFAESCGLLTVRTARPFYTVRKGTFLEFFDQYLDFLTTLLVSIG